MLKQVFLFKRIIIGLLSALLLSAGSVMAADKEVEPVANALSFSSTAPIAIKAENLKMSNKGEGGQNAVYTGNVVVTQAALTIKADKLTIISKKSKIQSLEAQGKPVRVVNLDKDNSIDAQAEMIVYEIKSGWLNLSGGKPEINHNGNKISGKNIRYNLQNKDVEAEGSEGKPALLVIDPTTQ
jgi:lipopolysaccharide transport protein LptA